MITYLLQASLCLIAFYLFYLLLLKEDKFLNLHRAFLLGAVLISLSIPLIKIQWESVPKQATILELSNAINAMVTVDLADQSNQLHWTDYAQFIYLAGVIFFTMRLIRTMVNLVRLVRNSEKKKEVNYTLVFSNGKMPIASFYRYIFLGKALEMDKDALSLILVHERKHIRDFHSFDLAFMELVKILVWFNPIVFLYERSLKAVHEYICDQEVVRHSSKSRYEQLLIKSLFQRVGVPLVSSFNEISIKHRIHMMNKQKSFWLGKLKVLLSLPLAVLLIFACNPDSLPTTTPTEISGKVINSKGVGLPGVVVVADGSETGAVTNLAGEYRIGNLPSSTTALTFSFVGMKTQTMEIGSKVVIDAVLEDGESSVEPKSLSGAKAEIPVHRISENDGKVLVGNLSDKAGNPLVGINVVVLGEKRVEEDSDETPRTIRPKAVTDQYGNFEIETSEVVEKLVIHNPEDGTATVIAIQGK